MSIYVKLIKSPRKSKKFRMEFYIKKEETFEKILHQDFGAKGYEDFTIHKDKDRKRRYVSRHSKLKNWDKFYEPAGLSRYLLWSEPTIEKAFEKYLKMFDLKRLPKDI